MNEEIKNILNSDSTGNQNGDADEVEPEFSTIGIIFTVIGVISMILGAIIFLVFSFLPEKSAVEGVVLIGSGISCLAIGSVLGLLAKIASRLKRLNKTCESGFISIKSSVD